MVRAGSTRDLLAAVAVVAAMAIADPLSATAGNPCKLARLAQWTTRTDHRSPVVDGSVNGQPAGILLDTGARVSLVSAAAAKRLGLRPVPIKGYRIFGIGGESRTQEVYIDELQIAGHVRKDWMALVAGEHELGSEIAVLLGYDFFQQTDVEFDLFNNAVRLYQAIDCESASLAYWDGGAATLPMESPKRIEITVSINDRPIVAWIDSGASLSVLSLHAAAELGITPNTAGVTSGGCVYGLGANQFDSWIASFQTFAIGNEVIHNPRIRFADIWRYSKVERTGSHIARPIENFPDILLGADFLRSHRVLIAHSQGKVYFTYAGGGVFPVGNTTCGSENR